MNPPFAPLFDYEARIISLLGRIDTPHIDLVVDQLLRLDTDSNRKIMVFVSCQGGSIVDGLKLVDCLGLLRSHLTAVGFGLVEGSAVLLLAQAQQRILFPSALISTAGLWDLPDLHPQAKSGIGLHQSSSMGDQLQCRLTNRLTNALIKSSHHLEDLLHTDAAPRILTAPECLQLGLADAIVEGPRRLLQKAKTHIHESINLSH